jgi:phage tail protein X
MAVSAWVDEYSRHRATDVFSTNDGDMFVEEREPIDTPADEYSAKHEAASSDSVFGLAGYYYNRLVPRAAGLWFAIMEANGIVDPTRRIRGGTELVIPDYAYVAEWLGLKHDPMV